MALERERQRAALAEWSHKLVLATRVPGRVVTAGKLADSDFGQWLRHKAAIFFDGTAELDSVWDVVREIDDVVLPQLRSDEAQGSRADKLILDLERWLEFIRYLMNDLFSRLGSALLGLAVGDELAWPGPGGKAMTVQVKEIVYQPESSGELHR